MLYWLAQLALAAFVSADVLYAGVNESGGEFGGNNLPGTYGTDYQFINETTVNIYAQQNHINVFRVPFLLERMCPPATGLGRTFNETHFQLYQTAINHITKTNGAYAILDPHNYMRYGDPSSATAGSIIGDVTDSKAASTLEFGAFWYELAQRFRANEKVIFGIMNEPHDMPTSLVFANDQAAIAGIRAAGARQLILAPGNAYTGGHSFMEAAESQQASSNLMAHLFDPLHNTAIDIHEYFDSDFSGQHAACSESFPDNMASLTTWLQQNNLKAFVSEFGGNNSTLCGQDIRTAIQYMASNPEYIGWSAWAAGPLWGTAAPCCADGAPLGSLEPGSSSGTGAPSMYESVWVDVIQPLVPQQLKRNGTSSLR